VNFLPFDERKSVALLKAALFIGGIAAVDWRIDLNIAFGLLYLFPLLIVGGVLPRWQIAGVALLCTVLADVFDPYKFTYNVALPQDVLMFSALAGAGLFAHEVRRNRLAQQQHVERLEEESSARRDAEEQLLFLIDSSPAAVFTAATDGTILLSNSAASRLLRTEGSLNGRNLFRYIPALRHVPLVEDPAREFRAEMQCKGERQNGEAFLANVFFSTYKTRLGARLAALVVDASEELRDREESTSQQLLAGSRLLANAVSHEVRNVCGAISVAHQNLLREGGLDRSKDFAALGALIETLNKIASFELKKSASRLEVGPVDVRDVLDALRIVLEPRAHEAGIQVEWNVPERPPLAVADRHSLLQVLLNLTRNSERALAAWPLRRISISVVEKGEKVSIVVRDTGPGISFPDRLFQPFQEGADSVGLGLYLSRAFMRSFGGDLRHEAKLPGCCFVAELQSARTLPTDGEGVDDDAHKIAAH
jgi:two-component system sensor kinase FixL